MPRLALALACSTLTVPAVADACGNSVLSSPYRRVHKAEAALDAANYRRAASLARDDIARQEDARHGGERGDAPGRETAILRCRQMAGHGPRCGAQ